MLKPKQFEFIESYKSTIECSREIFIKLCQSYTRTYIREIWYRNLSFKQIIFCRYTTNTKTTITQKCLRNLGLLLLLIELNNFSFLIDIIDNIMNTSISCDQNLPPMAVQYTGHVTQTESRDNDTALPLVGVLVT